MLAVFGVLRALTQAPVAAKSNATTCLRSSEHEYAKKTRRKWRKKWKEVHGARTPSRFASVARASAYWRVPVLHLSELGRTVHCTCATRLMSTIKITITVYAPWKERGTNERDKSAGRAKVEPPSLLGLRLACVYARENNTGRYRLYV